MKALTIRQPYASAVIYAGKDVENRTWRTKYRGELWIHAGLTSNQSDPDLPRSDLRGVMLGTVELVDVVTDSTSEWAEEGMFHWLLRNPMCLYRPIKMRGRQGLWTPEFRPGESPVLYPVEMF
ncbi:MAG: ASCH domain-containing protein [Actinomycetota bacterium]